MIKGLLTVSCLLLLLGISSIQPYVLRAENSEGLQKGNTAVININTASAEEIAAIPGLGEKKSEAIVKFREKHGAFARVEDLKKIDGIGDKLFEKIRPYVIVKVDNTLKPRQK